MHFDDILPLLGEFGTYQKRIYFLICLPKIIVAFQMLVFAFIAATPLHRCALWDWQNDTYAIQGHTHATLINATIPYSNKMDRTYNECWRYDVDIHTLFQEANNYSTQAYTKRRCNGWVYDTSEFKSTMVTELNLVCEDVLMKSHAQSVFFGGLVIGALTFGLLADHIGRKKVYILTIVLNAASGLAAAWAPEYYSFILLRMINGATNAGLMGNSFVIGMELVGPKKRVLAGMILPFFFTFGLALLAGIAYLVRDWRHLQIAISAPMAIFIVYAWLVPESPRWLIAKARYEEAEKIIQHAARVNKVTLPDNLFKNMEAENKVAGVQNSHGRIRDICSSKLLAARSFVMMYTWFVVNIVYYGITLNTGKLAGNRYLNFFLSGLVEFPAYTMLIFLLNRLGRKPLHIGSMIVCGIACTATLFPVIYAPDDMQWITTVLSLIGKFAGTSAFAIVYVLTSEMFPTVIRNAVLGIGSLSARVGGMVAPYIVALGGIVGGSWGKALPLIVMGVLAIIGGLLAFIFPETLGEKLPETIQDGINLGRKRPVSESDCHKPVENEKKSQHRFVYDNKAASLEDYPQDAQSRPAY